ncbi:MAG: RNA methyltransferase, partial [Muribaculaceae bacterium]|nr:RNA methyltransferase [Muribaculaceae bacterium]
INPGIYRKGFAFERWKDFDADLFESLYNDDSAERDFQYRIYGSDISPRAIAIAERNIRSAGVSKYINLQIKPLSAWDEAPAPAGVLVTNPPYGERISAPDMEGLYNTIGQRLKRAFQGWHAWIIGYRDEFFHNIGLAPSQRIPLLNGALECELREYVIFNGDKKTFIASGGKLKEERAERPAVQRHAGRNNEHRGTRPEHDSNRSERRKDNRRSQNTTFRDDRGGGYNRRPDKGSRRNTDKDFRNRTAPEISENPLSARRNPSALDSIIGQRPSLPPQKGPLMRERRGWRSGRKQSDDNNNEIK